MFACKKTFIPKVVTIYLPVLVSALLCLSYSYAWQETDTQELPSEDSDSRRIERLGEVTTDEWEMDLSLPSAAQNHLQDLRGAEALVSKGDAALAAQNVIEPENESALYYFKQALSQAPNNPSALKGLAAVQQSLLWLALESARELDFEMSEVWLWEASAMGNEQAPVAVTRDEVAVLKQSYANELEQKAFQAMDTGDFKLAGL